MELKEIQKTVHELAKQKGWHDIADVSLTERIMLVVTELAEAVECIRNNEPAMWQKGTSKVLGSETELIKLMPNSPDWKTEVKPEGVQTELADAIIRLLDIFESQGWDTEEAIRIKHQFNKTRPYRHNGKIL